MNSLWASLIVEELVRCGADYFCMAPGSRCTPLTVAVAENVQAKESIHYDERGVAFHALGYGRATGRPGVVVTTSGTAVANLMPAVVEASMERIPVILLTADRPPELRHTAANQTIDQTKFFGDYVRWFVDLPCPDRQVPLQMVLTTIDQAVYRSHSVPGGPVHINCMFREPLAPHPQGKGLRNYFISADAWLLGQGPFTNYAGPERAGHAKALARVQELLASTEQGLVVVGGLQDQSARGAACALLEKLQWPVCADITSGLRTGGPAGLVMDHCEILARSNTLSQAYRPETVLHLGGRFVSKHVASYIANSKPSRYILITDHPDRQDPGHQVSMRIEGDLSLICSELAGGLDRQKPSVWLQLWQNKSEAAREVFEAFAREGTDLNEPIVAFLISRHIPSGHALFLASSMPVRDFDLFADTNGPALRIGVNRGASGVDGTMASAAGFAEGLKQPVTLLIGDLAFLHDLNSLQYLRCGNHPVIAVVINNNGGGIFSFLPIARFEQVFEKYFATPHGLTFEPAAKMYDLPYYRPGNREEFLNHYRKALEGGRSAILEVHLDRKKNHALHQRLVRAMRDAVES